GIRDFHVTGVQTCALPISAGGAFLMAKVFIDAGHGGSDSGAVANGLKEKDLTLAIAKECEKALKAAGVQVKMSRTGDTYPSLSARCQAANSWGADLFVSIHIKDRKTTRLNSSHVKISYAVFCL